jgi:intracellular sulfur oxidation DsrE/DsrF family protein
MPKRLRFEDTVLLVPRDGMGEADLALQHKLMDKYLRLLLEGEALPAAMCFYAEGVKLVVDGSPVLERLREVEAEGVRLVVCSTCLDHFGLTDQVQVGIVGGMGDILEAQVRAGKVVTL